ncbi:MAG: hypothetical protein M3O15_07600 [Acidobacteriota bacterium]|nr:hypothetical protein [Acidobacteriota bacterium]
MAVVGCGPAASPKKVAAERRGEETTRPPSALPASDPAVVDDGGMEDLRQAALLGHMTGRLCGEMVHMTASVWSSSGPDAAIAYVSNSEAAALAGIRKGVEIQTALVEAARSKRKPTTSAAFDGVTALLVSEGSLCDLAFSPRGNYFSFQAEVARVETEKGRAEREFVMRVGSGFEAHELRKDIGDQMNAAVTAITRPERGLALADVRAAGGIADQAPSRSLAPYDTPPSSHYEPQPDDNAAALRHTLESAQRGRWQDRAPMKRRPDPTPTPDLSAWLSEHSAALVYLAGVARETARKAMMPATAGPACADLRGALGKLDDSGIVASYPGPDLDRALQAIRKGLAACDAGQRFTAPDQIQTGGMLLYRLAGAQTVQR